MSPEQARGKQADKRADIWSFGCVLYEVLASRPLFEGETVSDTLAAVIMREPDWEALPASTPRGIRQLLRRCLTKDPKQRLRDIGEARIVIEETLGGEGVGPGLPTTPGQVAPAMTGDLPRLPQGSALVRRALPWGIVGLILGALMAGALLLVERPQAPPRRIQRFSITLPPTLSFSTPFLTELALSPDGTNLVFSAKQGDKIQLYQRRMEDADARPIAGTEGGMGPFLSPDGASVAFLSGTMTRGADLSLRKINLAGGPAQSLCTSHTNYPGSWSTDGTIFFSSSDLQGLARVPSTGGNCQDLTTPDQGQGEVGHGLPQVLPGGQSLLFNVFRGVTSGQAAVAVLSLKTDKWQTVIHEGTNPHYVPGGYLVYARTGSLMAVPFDLSSLKVTGSPVPVLEDVMTNSEGGAAQFTFSLDGTLAYVAGNGAEARRKVLQVDRNGRPQVVTQNEGAYEDLDLSPDGRRIAMTIEGKAWNIWIYDISRATLTRFTFENDNRDPLWNSDGKSVAYTSFRWRQKTATVCAYPFQ